MHASHALLSGLAVSLLACGKKEAPPAPPTTAPTPTVTTDAGAVAEPDAAPPATDAGPAATADAMAAEVPPITVIGTSKEEPKDADRVYCDGPLDGRTPEYYVATASGTVAAHLRGPSGAVVTVQGKKVTLGADGADVELDVIEPLLGNGRDGSGTGLVNDHASFELGWTLPDGKTGGGTLTCTVMDALAKVLTRVRKGPVKWPGEGEQRYLKDAMLVAASGGVVTLEGDSSASLYNADFIALERDVPRNLSACQYDVVEAATGKRTGETVTKERAAIDIVIEVYDRRTGRKLKGKVFTAPTPSCPEQIPVDAVSAGAERGDMGTFYEDLLTPRGDVPELGRPVAEVKVDVTTAGAQIPETKLPPVRTIDQRFVGSIGCKPGDSKPMRDDDYDKSKYFSHSCMVGDDHFIAVNAHDWAPSKHTPAEGEDPTAYLVGGRTAVKVNAPAGDIQVLLPLLGGQTFATPDALAKALAPLGYVLDGEPSKGNDEPGLEDWSLTVKKDGATCILEYIDWGDAADGKAPTLAVARSKDGFVTVEGDDATLVKDTLAKLVK